MTRGHADLPRAVKNVVLSKRKIFDSLKKIDSDNAARQRILDMEKDFRRRIDQHIGGLPSNNATFQKFNTSPFVLMFHSRQKGYHHVSQIEKDIVPAKVFSSMETSAGRMVEAVALPIYGWRDVPSAMHSDESVLDGCKKTGDGTFMAATLKSGPRCLNDEMAKDIGIDVVTHARTWANKHNTNKVDFTYGVLYGTKKQSNKKDWHILRNMSQAMPASATVHAPHKGRWSIGYEDGGFHITATVRVGIEWWDYLGGENTWIELCASLIRACITPSLPEKNAVNYIISDLGQILDLGSIPAEYNVALLQRSQLEWLLFLSRHFCDELVA